LSRVESVDGKRRLAALAPRKIQMNRDAIISVCMFALVLAASNTALPPLTYAAGVAAIYVLRKALDHWGD